MVNNIAHFALPFGFGFVSSAFGMLVVFWANAGILLGGAAATARGAGRLQALATGAVAGLASRAAFNASSSTVSAAAVSPGRNP